MLNNHEDLERILLASGLSSTKGEPMARTRKMKHKIIVPCDKKHKLADVNVKFSTIRKLESEIKILTESYAALNTRIGTIWNIVGSISYDSRAVERTKNSLHNLAVETERERKRVFLFNCLNFIINIALFYLLFSKGVI
jgi:hypothetical protein